MSVTLKGTEGTFTVETANDYGLPKKKSLIKRFKGAVGRARQNIREYQEKAPERERQEIERLKRQISREKQRNELVRLRNQRRKLESYRSGGGLGLGGFSFSPSFTPFGEPTRRSVVKRHRTKKRKKRPQGRRVVMYV